MDNNEKVIKLQEGCAKICKRTWEDQAFKDRLLKEPGKVFQEYDIPLPAGYKKIEVHDGTKGTFHLVLKPKPQTSLLSEADLTTLAGGTSLPVVFDQ
jgi:hypothetical protein